MVPKGNKQLLDTMWLHGVLGCIGEQFDDGEEICGIVVNVRPKQVRNRSWEHGFPLRLHLLGALAPGSRAQLQHAAAQLMCSSAAVAMACHPGCPQAAQAAAVCLAGPGLLLSSCPWPLLLCLQDRISVWTKTAANEALQVRRGCRGGCIGTAQCRIAHHSLVRIAVTAPHGCLVTCHRT